MTQAQTAFFTAASLGLKNDKKRVLNDVIRGIKETVDTNSGNIDSNDTTIAAITGTLNKYADAFSVSGSTITFSGLVIADTIDVQTLNAANLQFEGNQTISGDFDVTGQAIINERLLIGTSGSSANPAFSFNNDKNTGIYRPGADQFAISTGGSEAARIDSSNRLLVGTSTTAINARLQVNGIIAWADNNNSNYTQPSIPGLANGGTTTFDIAIPNGTHAFQVTLAASANGGDRIGGVVANLYTSRYAATVRMSLHTISNYRWSFSSSSLSGSTLTITVTNSSGYAGYDGDVRIIQLA